MSAPAEIAALVARFEENRSAYTSGHYNETQVRHEFIDPFFKALGWDVNNEQGYAEAYKDLIHEDSIKVGGATKAPDYCFRIGGTRKFFLEAKRPGVNIKDNADAAFQIRRYAWSSKLPLSILTDFEEFAVYDCRIKPAKTDKASTARTFNLKYTDYLARWDEIASIFSRDAILKGSFDKYADSTKAKKGTAEVDDAFLKDISSYRADLAHNLALRNPGLTRRELNFAVQRIIDRIIFLRICEDRGIEEYGRLMALQNGTQVYERLGVLFQRADERYNSGLFHFHKEKGRLEPPDELTPGLILDDKPLKDIFKNLYYPDSPYEFSVLPADILGQVYEQFLGKVIRLTEGHRAVIEDKPEVKKAGGVYYTPTYIVDYIVKQTVGQLLAGRRPGPRGSASQLRILDPACGSGSFLIAAYQYLLDWHRDQYVDDGTDKHRRELYQGPGGDWRLTTSERQRILLNNIYGVDIDPQAVETTKLSLLLKVLEGESEQSITRQLAMFHERALPDLTDNIKCGNSLIGPDYYDNRQASFLDEEERYRINVFDWQAEFREVFRRDNPGFDTVIGNPPYIRPHRLAQEWKQYFWKHYTAFVRKADIYTCFLERGVEILRLSGRLGFIVSNGWLRLDSFEGLRRLLLERTSVEEIIDFTGNVFRDANVLTSIVVLRRGQAPGHVIEVATAAPASDLTSLLRKRVAQRAFEGTYKSNFDLSLGDDGDDAKRRMRSGGRALGDCFLVSFGLKTGDDSVYLTYSPQGEECKPLLRGEDVHRYSASFKGEFVRYLPSEMKAHRRTARPGTADRFEQPKVLVRDTGAGLVGTFDTESMYVKDVLIIADRNRRADRLLFLTGLLNSRLMRFYYETSFPTLHVQRDELASLPIPTIDGSARDGVANYHRIVVLVEQMLDLHKQLATASLPQEKTALQRQIDALDRQIDALVYQLYDLTDEEVAVVEGATSVP